jgi:hypothetical protein
LDDAYDDIILIVNHVYQLWIVIKMSKGGQREALSPPHIFLQPYLRPFILPPSGFSSKLALASSVSPSSKELVLPLLQVPASCPI